MKNISLNLDESISKETESVLLSIKKSRNKYINEAIDYYNRINKRKILEKKFIEASILVRDSSREVLDEFDAIEYEN